MINIINFPFHFKAELTILFSFTIASQKKYAELKCYKNTVCIDISNIRRRIKPT